MTRPILTQGLRATFGLVTLALAGAAQEPSRTPAQIKASYDVHKHEFDYLLGDWAITLHNARGTTHGFWSGVRLATGQILDEYRLVTDSGETRYLITAVRSYNAVLDQWELVNMDGQNGLQEIGTAHKVGNEMHLEQKIDQSQPNAIRRVRYYDIQPDHFLWSADVSVDGGKTWNLNVTRIEAKRIGPVRAIDLTSEKGPTSIAVAK